MFCKNVEKGENRTFQYVFTIVLTVLGYIFGQVPMYIAIYIAMNKHTELGKEELLKFSENPDFSIFYYDKNFGLFMILLTFIFAISALYLGVKYIHKRNFLSLISSEEKVDWNRIFWSTLVWFGMLFIVEFFFYLNNPGQYTFRSPDLSFIVLMLISLLILPIQTTFEEVFTRGYIFQSVAYNSKNVFVGLLVSMIVFILLHGFNPETVKYGFWPMMSYYFVAALLLGLIVVFDNRLELAIGVHTATNIFGALMVTYDGAAMQTDSLFSASMVNPIVLAGEILILGALFLYISSRKYKWDFNSINQKCND